MREYPRAPYLHDVILAMPYTCILGRGINISQKAILLNTDVSLIDKDIKLRVLFKIPYFDLQVHYHLFDCYASYLRDNIDQGTIALKIDDNVFQQKHICHYLEQSRKVIVDYLKTFELRNLSEKDRRNEQSKFTSFFNLDRHLDIDRCRSKALYFFSQLSQ